MNKRVYFSWLIVLPPILLISFLLFHNCIENIILRNTLFIIMLVLFILWPFYILPVTPFICSPKDKLPNKVNMLSFNNDIICKQLDRNNFLVYLYNRELKINMSGWIFKKTYIRDIVLMYYHLNYYNRNKFKSSKCLSKKFFPGQNISILFKMKNGKNKNLYLIKNGIEKRSFLCSFKIFILSGPLDRHTKYQKDKYYKNDINWFYM